MMRKPRSTVHTGRQVGVNTVVIYSFVKTIFPENININGLKLLMFIATQYWVTVQWRQFSCPNHKHLCVIQNQALIETALTSTDIVALTPTPTLWPFIGAA